MCTACTASTNNAFRCGPPGHFPIWQNNSLAHCDFKFGNDLTRFYTFRHVPRPISLNLSIRESDNLDFSLTFQNDLSGFHIEVPVLRVYLKARWLPDNQLNLIVWRTKVGVRSRETRLRAPRRGYYIPNFLTDLLVTTRHMANSFLVHV
jgi:hypothetical protein